MNKRTHKKGFTIVELVIVIAVIAILAAVLIPTFSGLIKKANQSADVQAVRQMNVVLATYDADNVADLAEAKEKLATSDIDANNYKPLSAGCDFYWVPSLNRVILVDADGTIVFPEDIKNDAAAVEETWMSLSGNGNVAEATKIIEAVSTGDVTLSGTTNLKGASINLAPTAANFTLGGTATAPATLTNVVSDEGSKVASNTGEYADNTYYAGLISVVGAGKTVTVENLTVSDAVVGDTTQADSARAGIIAGQVDGTLIIKNVVIEDSVVFGQYRIGALVGAVGSSGKVVIENVTIKNTTVKGTWITAALIGEVNKSATIQITNLKTENLTVEPSEFNNAVTDSSKVMTVNGHKFVCEDGDNTGFPYLTNEHYWMDLGGDNFTNPTYPGVEFWNFTAESGNYNP